MMLAPGYTAEQEAQHELAVRPQQNLSHDFAIQTYSTAVSIQDPEQIKKSMTQCGLHVFDQSWNQYHSGTFRECTLKVFGTTEEMTVPLQTCTKVMDVRNMVSKYCMVEADKLIFVAKQGCSFVKLKDADEMLSKVTVKGIKSFKPQMHQWPHTIAFLGAGYTGIKNAMLYNHYGQTNIIMFDRYDRVGGHAWLKTANKTSRLQTDLAAFHCWFGMEWADSYLKYPSDWSIWPKKDEVVAHMQHCVERSGLFPMIRLQQEVKTCQVVGKLQDFDRYYNLTVQDLKDQNKAPYSLNASVVYHFPGAYFLARNIVYPGEENCNMSIGFGMSDDMPYDNLDHKRVAILGNGAFAVENIRTCLEFGSEKIYLVTRRKNLACPRLACWFVHQGIFPTPAAMLLRMFVPMYDCGQMGDPWEYWSVGGNKATDKCVISSASRFGIGDVTFLAVATGRCEYVVDTVKRMSPNTLHMTGGGKIENIHTLVKALGLLADFGPDKMHGIKKMIGMFPDADHRRYVTADPLGMHASNFTTMSAGIGNYCSGKMVKFFVDHPREFIRCRDALGDGLPTSVANENKPCFQLHARDVQIASLLMEGCTPMITAGNAGVDDYMHRCVWAAAPLDKVMSECLNAWDAYQEEWKAQGYDHPYVAYPYSMDTIKEWMTEYEAKVGPLNVESKEQWIQQRIAAGTNFGLGGNSGPAKDDGAAADSMQWWKSNCTDTKYKMPGS